MTVFDPDSMVQSLKQNPAAALRELAAAVERGDLTVFSPRIQGNGFVQSRYGRNVFDVCFSMEAPVLKQGPNDRWLI